MKQRARQVLSRKLANKDGSILQLVIWELPEQLAGSAHGYKYRFYFGRDGVPIVRYDNERGKGDHRHYGGQQELYRFKDLETLLKDFLNDVSRYE
jgi:hypothetical protein